MSKLLNTNLICCTTTVKSAADAERIAKSLLGGHLAACVQVDGPMQSYYRWNNEDHCDEEYRLTIKSTLSGWPKLKSVLADTHPYDEPQITMFGIDDASDGYHQWVVDNVTQ